MESRSEKLITLLRSYKSVLIYIKGSPDPDAIASSYALHCICSLFGAKSEIVAERELSLEQNRQFVRMLSIPARFGVELKSSSGYDSYAVLDHQSADIPGITGKIPCIIHIDHHESENEDIDVHLSILDRSAGSVSTIMTLIIQDFSDKFDMAVLSKVCTALIFGIHTDTDNLSYATESESEAIRFLEKFADPVLRKKFSGSMPSKKTLNIASRAMLSYTIYKDWLIAGAGYVDSSDRDSVALAADIILRKKTAETVVVFAIVENREKRRLSLQASMRSTDPGINLNDIIKEITEEGGARKFKGAYQINLDYFFACPDREKLWDLINITTTETLKKRRDGIYFTELKGVYRSIKRSILDFLDGGK